MVEAGDARTPAVESLRGLQPAMHEMTLAIAHSMRMHATDASAIEHISYTRGNIGPTELGARLGISASSATEVVQRLVDSGRLERRRDETDRRRFTLVPTASALDEVRGYLTPLRARLDELAAGFSASEIDAIERYLHEAVRIFRESAADTRRSPTD